MKDDGREDLVGRGLVREEKGSQKEERRKILYERVELVMKEDEKEQEGSQNELREIE